MSRSLRRRFLSIVAAATVPSGVLLTRCGGGVPVVAVDASDAQLLVEERSCSAVLVSPVTIPDAGAYSDAADPLNGYWPDGSLPRAFCKVVCNRYMFSCETVMDASVPTFSCQPDCSGRRPEGISLPDAHANNEIGHYFARAAQLEAASVPAFRRLASELTGHGAPRSLVRAARRAVQDEQRHTLAARRLARRFGGVSARFRVAPFRPRSLEAMAIENAVEGQVGECFGALVATWQAQHAQDDEVRAHMNRIAIEETRHAELAARVHAWACTRLGTEERSVVEDRRREAIAKLRSEITGDPTREMQDVLGLPSAAVLSQMLDALFA